MHSAGAKRRNVVVNAVVGCLDQEDSGHRMRVDAQSCMNVVESQHDCGWFVERSIWCRILPMV